MKLFASLCLLLSASVTLAQSFSGPESIEWDPVNQGWIVANPGSGQLLSCDSQGNILSLFATPGSPYGTEVLHDTVYTCSSGGIKGYDLHSGTQVFNVNLGGSFLNGLTSDGDKYLFVTDFGANRILRVNVENGSHNVFASTSFTPNGVFYDADENRLVVVEWSFSAEIIGYSLADSTASTLATTSFGNIDGITRDDNGYWYVTPWSPASLQQFTPDFSSSTQVLSGLSSPADIDFSAQTDSVAIPNSGNNTLSFYHAPDSVPNTGIADTQAQLTLLVFPMPANEFARVAWPTPAADGTKLALYDLNGRLVQSQRVQAGATAARLALSELAPGQYLLRVENNSKVVASQSVVVQH